MPASGGDVRAVRSGIFAACFAPLRPCDWAERSADQIPHTVCHCSNIVWNCGRNLPEYGIGPGGARRLPLRGCLHNRHRRKAPDSPLFHQRRSFCCGLSCRQGHPGNIGQVRIEGAIYQASEESPGAFVALVAAFAGIVAIWYLLKNRRKVRKWWRRVTGRKNFWWYVVAWGLFFGFGAFFAFLDFRY